MKCFSSLETAYYSTLKDLKDKGHFVSPRESATREALGYGYVITNPRDRIISNKMRALNPFYLIGNFLWVMSKSNKLDFIEYYNPKGVNFSHDGETLPAAYGKRIFDIDGINQYENCIKELKLDPDSRRAIISIHLPQYDWRGYLDTSCTSDFQLFIRDNKLFMINHMRSQSAAMVMPYDVFLMTMLQEYIANELNVELGSYQHICGSIHYFERESDFIDEILANKTYTEPMDRMPKTSKDDLKKVLQFEKDLRKDAKETSRFNEYKWLEKIIQLNLDNYWNQIMIILIAKAMEHNNLPIKSFVGMYVKDPFKGLLAY